MKSRTLFLPRRQPPGVSAITSTTATMQHGRALVLSSAQSSQTASGAGQMVPRVGGGQVVPHSGAPPPNRGAQSIDAHMAGLEKSLANEGTAASKAPGAAAAVPTRSLVAPDLPRSLVNVTPGLL